MQDPPVNPIIAATHALKAAEAECKSKLAELDEAKADSARSQEACEQWDRTRAPLSAFATFAEEKVDLDASYRRTVGRHMFALSGYTLAVQRVEATKHALEKITAEAEHHRQQDDDKLAYEARIDALEANLRLQIEAVQAQQDDDKLAYEARIDALEARIDALEADRQARQTAETASANAKAAEEAKPSWKRLTWNDWAHALASFAVDLIGLYALWKHGRLTLSNGGLLSGFVGVLLKDVGHPIAMKGTSSWRWARDVVDWGSLVLIALCGILYSIGD